LNDTDRALISEYEAICAREIAYMLSLTAHDFKRCESSLLELANKLPTYKMIELRHAYDKRVWGK